MELKRGNKCPMLKKDCIQTECAWFICIAGKNPNTGEEKQDWGCAMAWLPVLMIENSLMQRQTGAAVESFRNEMVKAGASAPVFIPAVSPKELPNG